MHTTRKCFKREKRSIIWIATSRKNALWKWHLVCNLKGDKDLLNTENLEVDSGGWMDGSLIGVWLGRVSRMKGRVRKDISTRKRVRDQWARIKLSGDAVSPAWVTWSVWAESWTLSLMWWVGYCRLESDLCRFYWLTNGFWFTNRIQIQGSGCSLPSRVGKSRKDLWEALPVMSGLNEEPRPVGSREGPREVWLEAIMYLHGPF